MKLQPLKRKDRKKAFQIYENSFNAKKKKHTLKNNAILLGYYRNKTLIGIVQINIINNIFENEKIAYINSFCIDPKEQNKGYGNLFLKDVISYCQKKKINKINLTSNQNRVFAHKLYQKNDFEVIDTIFLKKDLKKEFTAI